MIDSVPLIQNPNDAQQINASIIAMKKASRELDEKIGKLNSLNSELDKKIDLLDSGLNKEIEDRKEAIKSLDVASVGGSGKYISAISETDGKISATAGNVTSTVSSGNSQPVTSGGVADYVGSMEFITDANNAIPPSNKDKTYHINYNGTNIPSNAYNFVITAYNGRSTASESNRRLVQMAYATGNQHYGEVYTRLATSSNGGNTWTWENWNKVITNNDLSSTWVDTGIISGSEGSIKYKKIGSLVALHIVSTNGSLKFTQSAGAMKRIREGVETVIYLPEEIRPVAVVPQINIYLIDNTFDTVFHARITSNGAITAWNNTLKNIQDVNSWLLDIVYSI